MEDVFTRASVRRDPSKLNPAVLVEDWISWLDAQAVSLSLSGAYVFRWKARIVLYETIKSRCLNKAVSKNALVVEALKFFCHLLAQS